MRVGGIFNGTGADVYLCIGFAPDWVHLWNPEATTPIEIVWSINMNRTGDVVDGFQFDWNSTFGSSDAEQLTKGNGIARYYGGTTLNSTTAGTTTYAEGVFLKPDNRDYRFTNADSPFGIGDAAEATIDTWTLDNATNFTGNFGTTGAVTGTYIGEGSPIIIDGRLYHIVALTADGGDANDVTLTHNVPSGEIQYIGGMYSMRPMIAGEVTKDGFLISNTTLNVDDDIVIFEAGKYDW